MKAILKEKIREYSKAIKDFIFGMSTFDLYRETLHIAKQYKDSMYILLLGEFLGIPFISNYYTLRLLPCLIEDIDVFKKEALKERDILEIISEYDVH